MKIGDILNITEHRPWPLPNENWKFYQEWNDAIFIHWQVDYNELKEFVPEELEIDLYEGKPWVSLVAFSMEKIRPKNLPSLQPISNFGEINIRTYIKSGYKTGVYFLSIEGGKVLSCKVAKAISELPYRYSRMKRSTNCYYSENLTIGDRFEIQYRIGKEMKVKKELDRWLTERYALFQDTKAWINEFDVHHVEWPMQELEIKKMTVDYPKFHKLINRSPDRIHYSKGVQVITWGKNKMKKLATTCK